MWKTSQERTYCSGVGEKWMMKWQQSVSTVSIAVRCGLLTYEVDITDALRSGSNVIEVEILQIRLGRPIEFVRKE